MRAIGRFAAALAACLFAGSTSPALAQAVSPLGLATGSELGVYFPVGAGLKLVMADAVARGAAAPALSLVATQGSVENLTGLRQGRWDFAIVQADQALDAFQGRGAFAAAGADGDLRVALRLYDETLALVVLKDAKIRKLTDIRGHRVVLGPVGSGTRAIAERLVRTIGGVVEVETRSGNLALALCGRQADAAFLLAGNPSTEVLSALTRCGTKLVPVAGPEAAALERDELPIEPTVIPGRAYPSARLDVPTLGVAALLVTRASVPDAAVGGLVRAVVDNLDLLKSLHPALYELEPDRLSPDPVSVPVPLHPAAKAVIDTIPPKAAP